MQALRLEAELISAFGTVDSGGLLLNSVLPSGLGKKIRGGGIVVPSGVREKAQLGLILLKESILELAKANASGTTNSDAASVLGLRSDYGGGSKDYLSFSVLGILMREGEMERQKTTRNISRECPNISHLRIGEVGLSNLLKARGAHRLLAILKRQQKASS